MSDLHHRRCAQFSARSRRHIESDPAEISFVTEDLRLETAELRLASMLRTFRTVEPSLQFRQAARERLWAEMRADLSRRPVRLPRPWIGARPRPNYRIGRGAAAVLVGLALFAGGLSVGQVLQALIIQPVSTSASPESVWQEANPAVPAEERGDRRSSPLAPSSRGGRLSAAPACSSVERVGSCRTLVPEMSFQRAALRDVRQ